VEESCQRKLLTKISLRFSPFLKGSRNDENKTSPNASLIHDDVQILNQGQHKNFSAKVAGISMPFTTLDEFL